MLVEGRHFHVGPAGEPDKYRLLASVGRGGEAELWEADMVVSGERERVAVKILHDDHSVEMNRWKTRWAEQVDLLRLVRHPGVVGVHEHFEGPRPHRAGEHDAGARALYMVMNWIDGQDLRDWVPEHARAEDRRMGMRHLAQIASTLDWLHSRKATSSGREVVHGDISPANIIINPDGQAVLVDFGLVRVARHVTAYAAGTPGYTAPEVARGGEYSAASDRYAFGGVAYYVLTGTHPPIDAGERRAGLATIAGLSDQPASAAQLETIFADDPAARPACTEWLRNLRMHSSTAPVRAVSLPPLAPGAPAPLTTVPASRLKSVFTVRPAITIIGACLVTAVMTALLFKLLPTSANPAGGEKPETPTAQQQTTSVPTSTATSPAPAPPTPSAAAQASSAALRPANAVSLTALEPVSENSAWSNGPATIDGRDHTQALVVDPCYDTQIEYALSGRYTTLRGVVGFQDRSPNTEPAAFKVFVDNNVVLTGTVRLRNPIALDVDVSGAVRLGLFFEVNSCSNGPLFAIGDPTLERRP